MAYLEEFEFHMEGYRVSVAEWALMFNRLLLEVARKLYYWSGLSREQRRCARAVQLVRDRPRGTTRYHSTLYPLLTNHTGELE